MAVDSGPHGRDRAPTCRDEGWGGVRGRRASAAAHREEGIPWGRRGPARTPDAAKLRRGETRPSRLNGLEPLPRRRGPRMPAGMDETARAAWRHVVREMGTADVITAADAFVLRLFCEAYSRYAVAARLYAMGGPLVNDRGHLAKNPLHQVVRDHADQVRLLARELGLSPAARASLQVGPSAHVPDIDAELGPPPRLRVMADDAG